MRIHAVLVSVFSTVFGLHAARGEPIEITAPLVRKSDLARVLDSNCDKVAVGNERKCTLKRATLETLAPGNVIRIHVEAALESRHVPVRGVVLYDTTATVAGTLDIDASTCKIKEFKLDSDSRIYNDILTIFQSQIRDRVDHFLSQCQ